MTFFSKIFKVFLMVGALVLLASCARNSEEHVVLSDKTVYIEQASYYYEQGYLRTGGWRYEMTIASEHQITDLEKLRKALVLEWTGEDFVVDQGYLLRWMDASGKVTEEMLVIDGSTVSMNGILYEANAQPLFDWLEMLDIAQQGME